ncbi:hypothetical protein G7Y89_g2360 [Cudoniella acicularis]|uniref:Heterokaryon incompatibility domain-containing protein n=1 Tax=Cudoniella acicularis TaxID=354080 RepID=A0A8H4W8P6_9HELO|nr:hypothetical protein G7Y89_g2360 [Cudoniella acicularis]
MTQKTGKSNLHAILLNASNHYVSSIYTNAALTIVAARAAHGADGCFSLRNQAKIIATVTNEAKQTNIYARILPDSHFLYTAWHVPSNEDILDFPLYDRGWCVQERLLSSRLVQYGRAEMLTEENDILTALSGLATRYQELGRGRYVAGLWEEDLIQGLLWYSVTPGVSWNSVAPARRSKSYTAPTFSWANRFGPIEWGSVNEDSEQLVRVLGVYTKTEETYPFGKVSDGFLTLSGALIPSTLETKHSASWLHSPDVLFRSHPFVFMDIPEDTNINCSRHVFCLPLLAEMYRGLGSNKYPLPLRFNALILEQVTGGVYRRIGLLNTAEGPIVERTWLEGLHQQELKII